MVFSSIVFLTLFLPLCLLAYYLSNNKLKNLVLLIFSFLFYGWGEPSFTIILFLSIGANYLFGLQIGSKVEKKTQKQLYLALGLLFNFGILVYFKYANFLFENLNLVLGIIGNEGLPLRKIVLPIGISFYTFQSVSYLIDVSRKEVEAQKSIFSLALYVSLFPQLIAGPIVRYKDIDDQLQVRYHSLNKFAEGVDRFIIGLSKKVLIANNVAVVADEVFNSPVANISTGYAWLGILAYSIQIYFDFSGYSDMALGLAKMFGFTFIENFNYPYLSKSIQEFWRRWHISLSNWFRDYLYIPLGGNKVSSGRLYTNLFIVFFTTGLWHGASWSFIVWGLFHGFFLVLERLFLGKVLKSLPNLLPRVYTLSIAMIGWVFFRADNLNNALQYVGLMFGINSPDESAVNTTLVLYINPIFYLALTFGIIAMFGGLQPIRKALYADGLGPDGQDTHTPKISPLVIIYIALQFILLLISVIILSANTFNPFIYFRF